MLARLSCAPEWVGSIPTHSAYIFLLTRQPPATYPSRISSPLQRALALGLSHVRVQVNFSYQHTQSPLLAEEKEDHHPLTAFSPKGGKLHIPRVSIANVDDIIPKLRSHVSSPDPQDRAANLRDLYLYVCTHGARDCRCGQTGSAVVRILRDEIAPRQNTHSSTLEGRHVNLAEVGHVGGHKCVIWS